jgi:CxxC motif-containing protein (DUF1111 family)
MMTQKNWIVLFLFAGLVVVIVSCQDLIPAAPEEDALLDGTIEGLTYAESRQFLAGDIAVNDLIFTSDAGLGPLFVGKSCGSCHAGDGKGHPFTTLTRFGQDDDSGNKFIGRGGPQLQDRALAGFDAEQLPTGIAFSKFVAPITTGLGFLDLVSDADILAMADPNDLDGDGISGVPNWAVVPDYVKVRENAIEQNGKYIHRFGKKASVYDLLQQTATAFNQDIGITSIFEPIDAYSNLEIDPEVSTSTVNDVVFYLRALKAPVQRTPENQEIVKGTALFKQVGCESCHRQTLKTGFSPLTGLSNKEFHPYTDLLLHDMGSGLDDGYTEGSAKTFEWRTPPLWGLGLSPDSQGGGYFLLHDGRAKSIEEAIMLHGGEGAASRTAFTQLPVSDKQAIIKFLESL